MNLNKEIQILPIHQAVLYSNMISETKFEEKEKLIQKFLIHPKKITDQEKEVIIKVLGYQSQEKVITAINDLDLVLREISLLYLSRNISVNPKLLMAFREVGWLKKKNYTILRNELKAKGCKKIAEEYFD